MFEDKESREKLKNIFNNISKLETDLVPSFKECLENNEPIGIYVATKDKTDVEWVFGSKEISSMLGGEKFLKEAYEKMFSLGEKEEDWIVFAVLNKVGPIYITRFDKNLLKEVFIN